MLPRAPFLSPGLFVHPSASSPNLGPSPLSDVFADVIYRFANQLTASTGNGKEGIGVSGAWRA